MYSHLFILLYTVNYKLIASHGHSPTHAPQSTHVSASTVALSSSIVIASTGQAPTHALQPVQRSLFTTAAIFPAFLLDVGG